MRQVAAYFALPRSDRRRLIEAFVTLEVVRIALRLFAIERVRAWASRRRQGTASVDRIVWAVRTAARWMPGTTCLYSALTLQRLLASQGYSSELHIGVARQEQRFAAHAWLERDGEVLIGEQGHDDYTRLTIWPVA